MLGLGDQLWRVAGRGAFLCGGGENPSMKRGRMHWAINELVEQGRSC
jgi:hypothetical protein